MYKEIIKRHLEETNMNWDYDINDILFFRETLIKKLENNKLLKKDRESLILLLNLLTF